MNAVNLFQRLSKRLSAHRNREGHWVGQLSSSALSTATSISAFSFYLETDVPSPETREDLESRIELGIRWIMSCQNQDGGWGDTDKSKSNISTSMLVEAAIAAAGRTKEFSSQIAHCREYISGEGGIPGLRARYGIDKTFAVPILANCAMSGLVPWSEVSVLPFEAACVPQRFYHLLQLPVVSYAIPALVAIGQAKFVNDPPWNPVSRVVRKASIGRSLKVLQRMQPSTGGFLEAAPLTGFVSMGLIKSGRADSPVVKNGIRFLQESFQPANAASGSFAASVPIDTNLATWVSTLSVNALANYPATFSRDPAEWQELLDWILSCQNTEVHPFTGAAPGGWGWTDLSGAVPDADDTPGALIALKNFFDLVDFDGPTKQRISVAAEQGLDWLLGLQNRDKGWPTFCRGWGKLPFDRSGSDLTAHAIRAFVVWQTLFDSPKMQKAIDSGFQYLTKNQRMDGSWLPLWFGNQDKVDDENPVYGTAKVLAAFRDAQRFDTQPAQDGLNWLAGSQNLDGGWGGGLSLTWTSEELGNSSVEETSLATELLFSTCDPDLDGVIDQSTLESWRAAAKRGFEWLKRATDLGVIETSSPIGFYFAKLWYYEQLYPLIFATSAAGAAARWSPEGKFGAGI